MTGLDRAHSFGFRGKGINIAVIDTGIDYTHPDLGGCFGPGCRVAKGTHTVNALSRLLISTQVMTLSEIVSVVPGTSESVLMSSQSTLQLALRHRATTRYLNASADRTVRPRRHFSICPDSAICRHARRWHRSRRHEPRYRHRWRRPGGALSLPRSRCID
jgi:hypothetical protein